MFRDRVISSSLVLLLSLIVVLFFGPRLFALVVAVFAACVLYEYYRMLARKGLRIDSRFAFCLGVTIPVLALIECECGCEGLLSCACAASIALLCIHSLFRKKDGNLLEMLALTLFGVVYIGWFFGFMVKARCESDLFDGRRAVLALIVLTQAADIGAYCVGSLFGRHLLSPRISPKKTVEGVLGGAVIATGIAWGVPAFLPGLCIAERVIIGLAVGGLVPVADLTESFIKRECGVKDSGNAFPGLGGFFDMLDSTILTAPFFYFLMTFCTMR